MPSSTGIFTWRLSARGKEHRLPNFQGKISKPVEDGGAVGVGPGWGWFLDGGWERRFSEAGLAAAGT